MPGGGQFARAATFDEVLREQPTASSEQREDQDRVDARMAAWCASSTGGDWPLFARRLERDGWDCDSVRSKFTESGSWQPSAQWVDDAEWVRQSLGVESGSDSAFLDGHPFSDLFRPLVDDAERRLWERADPRPLTADAHRDLRTMLLADLTGLCAPVLYQIFTETGCNYSKFTYHMTHGRMSRLLDEKPVLLRLIVDLVRHWLDSSAEFMVRLVGDIGVVRDELAGVPSGEPVIRIRSGLSDRHRGGRSVLQVEFSDGVRVLYKPKDVHVDAAWYSMVKWLNETGSPLQLRSPKVIARRGYGWVEFVEHTGCADEEGCARFYRRAGALLALLHCFAVADVHHENVIAAGEYPVPVDLEVAFQPGVLLSDHEPERGAFDAAAAVVADSVVSVGLLPGYAWSGDREPYVIGGFVAEWTSGTRLQWSDVNTDAMRPQMIPAPTIRTNVPRVADKYVGLSRHLDQFLAGFVEYARFLQSCDWTDVIEQFAGATVRKLLRPTQFYQLVLDRLRDHRVMGDGVLWSAQADFVARLADWNLQDDPMWPLLGAERKALLELDVPLFTMAVDEDIVADGTGISARLPVLPGLQRVRDRLARIDENEIRWQSEVIRQTASFVHADAPEVGLLDGVKRMPFGRLLSEADDIADTLSRHAVRRGSAAAWIGLSWFAGSDASRLTVLGHDLYNGNGGVAIFLAAHGRTRGCSSSAELARAALVHLRAEIRSNNAAHLSRVLGIGGAAGMASIVYALANTGHLLDDESLMADARRAADLITDGLIAADRRWDVISGSAGAILALLPLYRTAGDADVLDRIDACAKHLLTHRPQDATLSGMGHGAVGFALALSSAAFLTRSPRYAEAARCWMDFMRTGRAAESDESTCSGHASIRTGEPDRRSQWCHGEVGIGLAALSMARQGCEADDGDIQGALAGALQAGAGHVDTLCCGSLGNIEFFRTAGAQLHDSNLKEVAEHTLASVLRTKDARGRFRWNGGDTRFNLGLFRGLAGVGYTCLRGVDESLPNVLLWE